MSEQDRLIQKIWAGTIHILWKRVRTKKGYCYHLSLCKNTYERNKNNKHSLESITLIISLWTLYLSLLLSSSHKKKKERQGTRIKSTSLGQQLEKEMTQNVKTGYPWYGDEYKQKEPLLKGQPWKKDAALKSVDPSISRSCSLLQTMAGSETNVDWMALGVYQWSRSASISAAKEQGQDQDNSSLANI